MPCICDFGVTGDCLVLAWIFGCCLRGGCFAFVVRCTGACGWWVARIWCGVLSGFRSLGADVFACWRLRLGGELLVVFAGLLWFYV